MMTELAEKVRRALCEHGTADGIGIRPINSDDDLWFAVIECRITPEQEDFVNPAGFSIGRAYLRPNENLPCVIFKEDGTLIGYIVFRKWLGHGEAISWSYYIDKRYQGQGCGRSAAILAVKVLRAAFPNMPIKLSTEAANTKAQQLYQSIGFKRTAELDGDDLVFVI